ncbi:MAG: succinate dehydrogenase [Thermodesulfobacteriota bacterium]|jgi:succinate dehydrogenase / fumarate reductase cytochrome b subunit
MANGSEWILKREATDARVWRSTLPGMWAWLMQRVSAILILLFLTLHFFLPYRRPLQFLLLLVVALHASLGIRVFLIDLGADVKTQRTLFIISVLLAAFGLFFVWNYLPLGG